jgi:hypothetical protein
VFAAEDMLSRYKMLMIFLAVLAAVALGDRFFSSKGSIEQALPPEPTNNSNISDAVASEASPSSNGGGEDPDQVVATVRSEIELDSAQIELDEATLKSLEQSVVSQALEAARGLVKSSQASAAMDFVPSSKSRLLSIGGQNLGIVEATLTPATKRDAESATGSGAGVPVTPIANVYFTRVYGVVNESFVSVACIRPSGKLVSILSGGCGEKLSEVFGVELIP